MLQKLSIFILLASALSVQAMEQQITATQSSPLAKVQNETRLYDKLKKQFESKELKPRFSIDLLLAVDVEKGTCKTNSPFKAVYAKLITEVGKDQLYALMMKDFTEAKELFIIPTLQEARNIRSFAVDCLKIMLCAFPEEWPTQKFQDVLILRNQCEELLKSFAPIGARLLPCGMLLEEMGPSTLFL